MIEKDLKTFVSVTANYFEKTTREPAELSPPAINFDGAVFLEFTGIIAISGKAEGCVYLTADRAMLDQLMEDIGAHVERSDENMMDLIGEVANVIASNVRRDFGPEFKVSTPVTMHGSETEPPVPIAEVTMSIPIQWRGHTSYLVLGLNDELN